MDIHYPESELILNADGSVFHLHLQPEQLADNVILVGDPDRVNLVASHLHTQESETRNREFHTITGTRGCKRITVVSTGIGCDNIDIVMNELDALANIDLHTRTDRPAHRSLNIVRIGTCGGLQPFTPIGTFICSDISIGLDGLLNFYHSDSGIRDSVLEHQFHTHMGWQGQTCIAYPYAVHADEELIRRIGADDMVHGITLSAGGFYGPQGRRLRIPLADPEQNTKVEQFAYGAYHITNYEMESSAVAGLARLLGHHAVTTCMVIANRRTGQANAQYKNTMDTLIETVLERI